MATDLNEARKVATDRLQRARNIDYLYIVHIGNNRYIVVSEAFYPQLSNEYDTFEIKDTVYKDD